MDDVKLSGEQSPAERRPHRGRTSEAESRDDWQTPPSFLDGLRQRWWFALDAACSLDNAVALHGLTAEHSGLAHDWRPANGLETQHTAPPALPGAMPAVWCNPPYGYRGKLSRAFVARGAQQARDVCGPAGLDLVMLLGATPDVRWFHECVLGGAWPASEVWFTQGRLAFIDPDRGEAAGQNTGGSTLLVWRAGWRRPGGPFLGSLRRDGVPAGGAW